jgi:hypothetical protein
MLEFNDARPNDASTYHTRKLTLLSMKGRSHPGL